MQGSQRLWLSAAAISLIVSLAFAAGFALGQGSGNPSSASLEGRGTDLIGSVFDRIRSSSVDPPSVGALTDGAIKGMVQVLKKDGDPYALFFSPESLNSFEELTSGRFSGIGVWIKQIGRKLKVVSVLPSTPALDAGLKEGDVITMIDDRAVKGLSTDEAVARIKGPPGTSVKLRVLRDGDVMKYRITRASIVLPTVTAKMIEGDRGYVRVLTFSRGVGARTREEVGSLLRRGARGIVLDLRDNGGGLFDEGIDVASDFIEDGEIVTYKARSEREVVYEAEGDAFEDVPLVVLVNGGTASASEIVTGALQDRDRATVVGTKTYGKGSVQQVLALPASGALKLTVAAYYTPDGKNLSGNGIAPDVEVEGSPAKQLRRAVQILESLIAQGK